MKEKLILIGGGGHAKACIDVIEQEDRFEIAGIIDVPEKIGVEVLGYKVMGTDEDLKSLAQDYGFFLVTIGQLETPSRRMACFERVKNVGAKLPVVTSPLAYVSKHARVGEGTIVMHQAVVNAGAEIGVNCIINTKALVEHDAVVRDHCHVSTNAVVNGGVVVGSRTFFGSNATSRQCITIPEDSFIRANSLETGK